MILIGLDDNTTQIKPLKTMWAVKYLVQKKSFCIRFDMYGVDIVVGQVMVGIFVLSSLFTFVYDLWRSLQRVKKTNKSDLHPTQRASLFFSTTKNDQAIKKML